jgi:phage gp29-like protein
MRIPFINKEIILTERRPSKRELEASYGAPGQTFFAGLIGETGEYNPDLKFPACIEVYDKMRRSDAMVFATLQVVKLPVLAVDWQIKCEREDVKEFLEEQLFHRLNFKQFVRQALLMLDYGFMLFEKVYKVEGNRIVLKKIPARMPASLWKWNVEEDELVGVTQLVWKDGKYEQPFIPRWKIVVFNINQEGNNYEGRSLLRSSYKHWYIKDQLYKIDAIAKERHGVGIPKVRLPEIYGDDDVTQAENLAKNLKAGEQAYIIEPPGYEVGILEQSGRSEDCLPSIQHHNEMIAMNILASFLVFGTTRTAARATAVVLEDLFLQSLEGILAELAETIDQDIIRQLVEWNFGEGIEAHISPGSVRKRKVGELSAAISALVRAGALTPSTDIENYLRRIIGLPPVEESGGEEPKSAETE